MRNKLSYIIIIAMFLLGASVFLYPTVSNYLYEKNSSKAIMQHSEKGEKISPERIAEEKEAVRRYNESLVDNAVVLTDPFDPEAFPITDGNYEELLAFDEIMGVIEIPAIDVKLPIYHGTTEDVLEKGAGHLENTSLPIGGDSTHAVISSHCGLPSARLFTDLASVKMGDIFRIYVLDEVLSYEVYKIEVVLPDVTSSLMIKKDEDLVTLITCTPYGKNTHRLLVHGKRTEEVQKQNKLDSDGQDKKTLKRILGFIALTLALIFAILMILVLPSKIKRRLKGGDDSE